MKNNNQKAKIIITTEVDSTTKSLNITSDIYIDEKVVAARKYEIPFSEITFDEKFKQICSETFGTLKYYGNGFGC